MNVKVINRSSRTTKVSSKDFVVYLCKDAQYSFEISEEEAFAINTIRSDAQAIYHYEGRDDLTVEVLDSNSTMGRKITAIQTAFADARR